MIEGTISGAGISGEVIGAELLGEMLSAGIVGGVGSGTFIVNEYVLSVSDITGGHRLTVVKGSVTQTVDILNGTNGEDGEDGTDGYAPVVTVTEITGGHCVTITDASHIENPHTFNVMDGTGSGDEMTSNKVTSLSAQSTDTQYPSAKCVYDLLGDVESILDSIIGGV